MGGSISSGISNLGKGLGAVATGGLSIAAPKSLFGKVGNTVGNVLTLGAAKLGQNPDGTASASAGQTDPMTMLTQTGGAPLLANIAMGASVTDSLMGFFGASGNYDQWYSGLDQASQDAVNGLKNQLTEIQSNTDMKNQAVQKLVTDFPNYMQTMIPQYKGIADKATMDAAQKALDQTAAKYAAGGQVSSGAMDAAMARTAAGTAEQNLGYGTNLALTDWTNQYSTASALQSFQQKMLGQGATQGFNAMQNYLNNNAQNARQSAGFANEANVASRNENNALTNAIGSFGGTVLGASLFGPMGAAVGANATNSSNSAGAPTNVPSPNNAAQGPGTGVYFS